jgi:hypothetical protein
MMVASFWLLPAQRAEAVDPSTGDSAQQAATDGTFLASVAAANDNDSNGNGSDSNDNSSNDNGGNDNNTAETTSGQSENSAQASAAQNSAQPIGQQSPAGGTAAGGSVTQNVAQAAQPCGFTLGFRTLHDMIPNVVGDCVENEWHNAVNGDAIQRTTRGMMVWRKADNWTAFTDGTQTWINGPMGLQSRSNNERFPWEAQTATPQPGDPGFQPGAGQGGSSSGAAAGGSAGSDTGAGGSNNSGSGNSGTQNTGTSNTGTGSSSGGASGGGDSSTGDSTP